MFTNLPHSAAEEQNQNLLYWPSMLTHYEKFEGEFLGPLKVNFFFLFTIFWHFCTLSFTEDSSFPYHTTDRGLCLHLVTRNEHNSKSELSCLKKDSSDRNIILCRQVLVMLFPSKGTSWTSSEKVSFLRGTECERCIERLSTTPLAHCWTAWRTFSHSQGKKSDKLFLICCPTTKVTRVCRLVTEINTTVNVHYLLLSKIIFTVCTKV